MSLATRFLLPEIQSGRFGNSNSRRFSAKQSFDFGRQRDANAETKHRYHYGNNIELHNSPFIAQLVSHSRHYIALVVQPLLRNLDASLLLEGNRGAPTSATNN